MTTSDSPHTRCRGRRRPRPVQPPPRRPVSSPPSAAPPSPPGATPATAAPAPTHPRGASRAHPSRLAHCRPARIHPPAAERPDPMPLTPVLTIRWGADESWRLATYERLEGYSAMRTALRMAPDELVGMVKDSGLRG